MTIHEASRTLLKSPPELWAECSDAASLGRHLDQFGEIKITRLEPETAVAWEGEHVSGTVRLESSGWGTRVILTAQEVDLPDLGTPPKRDVEHLGAPEPANAEPGGVEPGSVEPGSVEPGGAEPGGVEPGRVEPGGVEPGSAEHASLDIEPPEPHPVPVVEEPDTVTASPESVEARAAVGTAPPAPRKGLFARFLARMRGPVPEPETGRPAAAKPAGSGHPLALEHSVAPEPQVAPEPASESEPTAGPRPDPTVAGEPTVEPRPDPTVAAEPTVEPRSEPALEQQAAPDVSPEPARVGPAPATEIALKDALESLGSAHHRPFSRA